MNMIIDSETLDQIILTARVMHTRLQATMPGDTDVDGMVAASMPTIIALASNRAASQRQAEINRDQAAMRATDPDH